LYCVARDIAWTSKLYRGKSSSHSFYNQTSWSLEDTQNSTKHLI
jgi:hypothetical protein